MTFMICMQALPRWLRVLVCSYLVSPLSTSRTCRVLRACRPREVQLL